MKGRWLGNAISLRVVNADAAKRCEHVLIFHKLGNSALAHDMANAIDRLHHSSIDRIGGHVFDECPIDLQEIYRQVL